MTRKTPIGDIGKHKKKVTIADELTITSYYNLDPPLPPNDLWLCWLDPSEMEMSKQPRHRLIVGGSFGSVLTQTANDLLPTYIKEEALRSGMVKFETLYSLTWSKVKRKVLRKFNLTDLEFDAGVDKVVKLGIQSQQPLYDPDAHANRVRNVLRAVKIRHPHVRCSPEGCMTSGTCPMGIQQALRKLALETHGK